MLADRHAVRSSNLLQISFSITIKLYFIASRICHLRWCALRKVLCTVGLWKLNRRAVLQLRQPSLAVPTLNSFVEAIAYLRLTINCIAVAGAF